MLKDVPTAKESGFPDYVVDQLERARSSRQVPPEIINILHDGVIKALADPDIKSQGAQFGNRFNRQHAAGNA